MKIRKGTIKDFDYLFKILNSVPQLQHHGDKDSYPKEWVKSFLTSKDQVVFIAEENMVTIGLIIAEVGGERHSSYVWDLYVDEKYRKKGVASDLIKHHEEYCKKVGINQVGLSVLIDNQDMQGFIEKKGYNKGNASYYYSKEI